MKSILFVDDDPNVLEALERMLFSMRNEWQIAFCGSGQEALEFMAGTPVDVLVADLRMPGMNGAALLREVMTAYPQTIRFVLSGQTDKDTIVRSVGPAHQFLAKPCSATLLKSCVNRAFALRTLLDNPSLKELVAQLDSLPALPQSYTRLKEELASEDASMNTVGKIIESDPGMTAKVLQVINAAFSGVRQRVSNVTQAVSLLGLDTIESLVLMVGVFSVGEKGVGAAPFSLEWLWRHSMSVGRFAQAISREEDAGETTAHDAFTAGILHDAGMLILAQNCTEVYARVLQHAAANGRPLYQVEIETFGCTQAQVGAYLLGLWGVPDSIVEAVAFHHGPGQCLGGRFGPVTAVHAAHAIECALSGGDARSPETEVDLAYLASLELAERVDIWRKLCSSLVHEEGAAP